MSSIYFNEEHQLFRESVASFVQKEIVPYGLDWEKNKRIPKSLLKKLGDLGFLGINHEEKYGGSNADFFYSVAYLEELCKCGLGGVTAMIGVHQYMATNHLAEAGSHELKEKYLVPSIAGDMLAAIAITEPGGGSDVSALLTTAVKDGDEYIINGSKTFITNGVYCDFVVVACRTNTKAGVNGISLIVVDRESEGFSATNLNKLGWHSSDTGELSFDNVKVPVTNLVGEENQGFFYIMESFQLERLAAAIMANAGSEHILAVTLKYMNERETFGRKINRYQVLRHDIVNMYTELEASKQLTYHTCRQFEEGKIPVKECSMAKLFSTELAIKITDICFQMFGGYAYMEDYPVARAYRDVRVGTIAGGTSQIMREILAKMIIDDVRYKKVYNESDSEKNADSKPLTAKEIILSLPTRLKTDKLNGEQFVFNFDIDGKDGGQYTVEIANKACKVSEGLIDNPDCLVSCTDKVYRDVETGQMSAETAVMSGQIKITNLMAMMSFSKLFNRVTS